MRVLVLGFNKKIWCVLNSWKNHPFVMFFMPEFTNLLVSVGSPTELESIYILRNEDDQDDEENDIKFGSFKCVEQFCDRFNEEFECKFKDHKSVVKTIYLISNGRDEDKLKEQSYCDKIRDRLNQRYDFNLSVHLQKPLVAPPKNIQSTNQIVTQNNRDINDKIIEQLKIYRKILRNENTRCFSGFISFFYTRKIDKITILNELIKKFEGLDHYSEILNNLDPKLIKGKRSHRAKNLVDNIRAGHFEHGIQDPSTYKPKLATPSSVI